MISKKPIKTASGNPQLKSGFIFLLNDEKPDAIKVINESIEKMKKENLSLSTFHLLTKNPSEFRELAGNELKLSALTNDNYGEFFSDKEMDRVFLWNEAEKLTSLVNFNEFFKHTVPAPEPDEYSELEWNNQPLNISPGILLSTETAKFIFSQLAITGKNFKEDIPFFLRNLHLKKIQSTKILSECPFSPSGKLSFKPNISSSTSRWYKWNIQLPLKDGFRNMKDHPVVGEPSISRLIFFIVAALTFITLPIISYHAGISGDEEKHYMHAEKVYNYFATAGKDSSALSDPQLKLNYYGQSFDLLTFLAVKVLNTDKIYEVRHVMNGTLGALTIIVAGLLARYLAGSMTGILTMLFLFFSPRFLGHSMNNPMDIPFALGYVFTIFQIIRFLDRLPRFSYTIASLIALGIAFTISIRIGGLLLIPYLFMFSGLYLLVRRWPWELFSKGWLRFAGKGLEFLLIISIAGYFISLIPWPYGLKNPVKNPLESLKMMSNIEVSLRVLFNGSIHWSDKLPWFYIPKFILISVPAIILLGFILSVAFMSIWKKIAQPFWLFVLMFSTIFPVIYIIYKESNVYGGWRHLIFIYPTLVVLAAASFRIIYQLLDKKLLRIILGIVLAGSLISPALHIIRNYPNQYIYFNQLVGGVNKAYKNYETDYYLVSLKSGTDWLKDNVLGKMEAGENSPVKIISNAPTLIMQYYFKDFIDIVETPYTRYYDRGMHDWDYAVFFCNYIDPYQIRKGIWPPKNTVYTVKVDDVTVCAVVKRENKNDFEGSAKLSRGLNEKDILIINEGLMQLEKAVEYDERNEVAYINLATGYIMLQKYELARQKLNRLLEIYPQYDRALSTIGYSYLSEGEFLRDGNKIDKAIAYFNEALKVNYKHATSYYNLGLAYYMKKDYQSAIQHLQSAVDFSPGYRDPYFLMIKILEETGHPQEAANLREYLQNL